MRAQSHARKEKDMLNLIKNFKTALCAAAITLTSAANAEVITYQVGTGDSTAHVLLNFYDQDQDQPGAEYLFEVSFNNVTTGLGLLDIIELASQLDETIPDLTTDRTFFPEGAFPADVFLNTITLGDDSNTNEPWPGKYWGYYNRDQADTPWDFASTGAGNRFVQDGQWDAWSFTGGLPTGVSIPEPASATLLLIGATLLTSRRK